MNITRTAHEEEMARITAAIDQSSALIAEMRATVEAARDQNRAIADAARGLLKALDFVCPSWREETLNQGDYGDEVNAAWDALVEAVEGGK